MKRRGNVGGVLEVGEGGGEGKGGGGEGGEGERGRSRRQILFLRRCACCMNTLHDAGVNVPLPWGKLRGWGRGAGGGVVKEEE